MRSSKRKTKDEAPFNYLLPHATKKAKYYGRKFKSHISGRDLWELCHATPSARTSKRKADEETEVSAKKRKIEEDFQSRLILQQKQWCRQPWRQYYKAATNDDKTRNSHLSPNTLYRWILPSPDTFRFGSLPMDIVRVISKLLNLSDMASLVYTCRTLRHGLTPMLEGRRKTTNELISAIGHRLSKEYLIKLLNAGADPNEMIHINTVSSLLFSCGSG